MEALLRIRPHQNSTHTHRDPLHLRLICLRWKAWREMSVNTCHFGLQYNTCTHTLHHSVRHPLISHVCVGGFGRCVFVRLVSLPSPLSSGRTTSLLQLQPQKDVQPGLDSDVFFSNQSHFTLPFI